MATFSKSVLDGVPRLVWETLTTAGDDGDPFAIVGQHGLAGSVQIIGTFGSATIVMQGSNDGTNWVTLKDVLGNSISTTSAAIFEFYTSCVYIRPASSGGSGDDVDVIVVLRG